MKALKKWPLEYALQVGQDGAAFRIPLPSGGGFLACIANIGGGWDHLSVHVQLPETTMMRAPSWGELQYVRKLFFKASEWAVQYSPAEDAHINIHPHTLHLWRPQDGFPVPPDWMV